MFAPLNLPIKNWRTQRVWVIGASTGIGAALAQELLQLGARVALSARSVDKLQSLAHAGAQAQLQAQPHAQPQALCVGLDITQEATVHAGLAQIKQAWGGVDLVLIVAGTHSEMRADSFDNAAAHALLATNLSGVLNCLAAVLPELCAQKNGGLGIVSSVAGYSGLPKALIYGASKAALINLCESLYFDLRPQGINVYLINPGFVATPLTEKNDFAMPALISAEKAAHVTILALARGNFEIHYPKRFTLWLKLLRLLPYRLYFYLAHKLTGL